MKDLIKMRVQESIRAKSLFSDELIENILICAKECIGAIENGGKLLVCGNGGSAADSQHFVAELVSKYRLERRGLPAIALTSNTSILTAVGNDYEFDRIFSRQVEALGTDKDVLFVISTSGSSKNIIQALYRAKENNLYRIGLTGENSGEMNNLCNLVLNAPSDVTPRIQECHILIIHIICEIIERSFCYE